jgi:hypothetical protein
MVDVTLFCLIEWSCFSNVHRKWNIYEKCKNEFHFHQEANSKPNKIWCQRKWHYCHTRIATMFSKKKNCNNVETKQDYKISRGISKFSFTVKLRPVSVEAVESDVHFRSHHIASGLVALHPLSFVAVWRPHMLLHLKRKRKQISWTSIYFWLESKWNLSKKAELNSPNLVPPRSHCEPC